MLKINIFRWFLLKIPNRTDLYLFIHLIHTLTFHFQKYKGTLLWTPPTSSRTDPKKIPIKTQSKEIQDPPHLPQPKYQKKIASFFFLLLWFFSLHSSELLSSFAKKMRKKILWRDHLLRKEIGDWRGQGGHKNRLEERRLFGDRA